MKTKQISLSYKNIRCADEKSKLFTTKLINLNINNKIIGEIK